MFESFCLFVGFAVKLKFLWQIFENLDHRRRQNVVRTSVTHSPNGLHFVGHFFCSYHILTSSVHVIYNWTDARQNGIYLLNKLLLLVVNKEQLRNNSRLKIVFARFSRVSKQNLHLRWFCITTLSDWHKKLSPLPRPINNGNRTEWSPIRSGLIRVINKIERPICLITSCSIINQSEL